MMCDCMRHTLPSQVERWMHPVSRIYAEERQSLGSDPEATDRPEGLCVPFGGELDIG